MRELILVVNPRAGRGAGTRLAPLLMTELGNHGFAVHLQETTGPRHATELVRAALDSGAPRVAIAGGDGSIFEAVNGWMQAGAPAGAALGLLPVGTGNDFVKMLGLSGDWRRNCAILAADRVRQVDLGKVDGRWFANGVGVGFDAQVALAANRIRWLRGTPVYAAALVQTLVRDFRTPRVQITHDDGCYEDEITLAAFANGRCYGGAFNIAPGASIDDGLLEMVVAKGLSRLAVLGFCPSVLRGTHLGRDEVTHAQTRTVTIESEQSMVVHADGEIIDQHARRLAISICPGALRVLA